MNNFTARHDFERAVAELLTKHNVSLNDDMDLHAALTLAGRLIDTHDARMRECREQLRRAMREGVPLAIIVDRDRKTADAIHAAEMKALEDGFCALTWPSDSAADELMDRFVARREFTRGQPITRQGKEDR